ncbi:MAG: AbrB/MazE/SpoVT family DNA-binding domain-containing protein [Rickettsiales bacterium]
MKVDIIKIGNSQGIRIPKAILKQCGFNGSVDLRVEDGDLVLAKPKRKPREGWAEAIEADIKKHGVPELLWPEDMINEFDKTEWTWPDGE